MINLCSDVLNKFEKMYRSQINLGFTSFQKAGVLHKNAPYEGRRCRSLDLFVCAFSGRLHIYSLGFVHVIFVEKLNTISETTDCSVEEFGRN